MRFTNEANGFSGFTVTGGTLAVTSPKALGGAASVTMNVGALELGGEAGADTRYATQITLANPVMTNALMLRVSQDVTLGSWTVSSGLPYKPSSTR